MDQPEGGSFALAVAAYVRFPPKAAIGLRHGRGRLPGPGTPRARRGIVG